MLVGQDQKYLGVLIVPNFENLDEYANGNEIAFKNHSALIKTKEIQELFSQEIRELISKKNGFKVHERIFKSKLLWKDFEVGQELSQKQEIKRHYIEDIYKKEIVDLFRKH